MTNWQKFLIAFSILLYMILNESGRINTRIDLDYHMWEYRRFLKTDEQYKKELLEITSQISDRLNTHTHIGMYGKPKLLP